ncbi:MAG: FtsX-like permease family protein [Xanthomonadales bacterium]|nr:FtsX-like permease family protein [Xanthomonadales bacterium]
MVCNVSFLLQRRASPLLTTDGVGDASKLLVATRVIARGSPWNAARLREVQAHLKALPHVESVTSAAAFPATHAAEIVTKVVGDGADTQADVVIYAGTNLIQTLQLDVVAGRSFSLQENNITMKGCCGFSQSGPVVISRDLANRLFPSGHALGKTISYQGFKGGLRTVVGIVAHLMTNRIAHAASGELEYTMLFPGVPNHWPRPVFALRGNTTDMVALRKDVASVIKHDLGGELYPASHPKVSSYSELHDAELAGEKASVILLSVVTLVVMLVAFIGIAATTQSWVARRTRHIGVYRALGARRQHILQAFQAENLLVMGAGLLLGLVAAYGVNLWLMQYYAFPPLPWRYLPLAALGFLLWGQLAALVPALRAAKIEPMDATRAV